ncbi:MAG TPA: hypothetical protein VFZ61_25610 [Polyangiales bacterium]
MALWSLFGAAGCAESHAGAKLRDAGPADAASQADAKDSQHDQQDEDGALPDDASTGDARAALDASAEAGLPPAGGREPEVPSTGTWPPVRAAGNTLRAVRADSSDVSLSLRPLTVCATLPTDARAVVDLEVRHTDCDTLGPIEVDVTDAGAVVLTVWLWRSDVCSQESSVSHHAFDLALGWGAGEYTFPQSMTPGSALTLTPKVADCAPKPREGSCEHDCECAKGQVCVYDRGTDSSCVGSCRPRCDNTYGCQGGGSYVECSQDAQCSPGRVCTEGRCRWVTVLGGDTRHACTRHADCAAGLRCVEGDSGALGCELPCNAANMLCPGIHYCTRDANYSSAHWVCEWGGE